MFQVIDTRGDAWFVKRAAEATEERQAAEVAAAVVGAALGLPVLPVRVMKGADVFASGWQTHESFTVSPWIQGMSVSEMADPDALLDSLSDDALMRLALYDYLIGNDDRYSRNVMVEMLDGYDHAQMASFLRERGNGDFVVRLIDNEYALERGIFGPLAGRTQSIFQEAALDRFGPDQPVSEQYVTWLAKGLAAAEEGLRAHVAPRQAARWLD